MKFDNNNPLIWRDASIPNDDVAMSVQDPLAPAPQIDNTTVCIATPRLDVMIEVVGDEMNTISQTEFRDMLTGALKEIRAMLGGRQG